MKSLSSRKSLPARGDGPIPSHLKTTLGTTLERDGMMRGKTASSLKP